MTDEIMHVIAECIAEAEWWAKSEDRVEAFNTKLAEYGYEIVPGWSDNLDAAPRDGTGVDLWITPPPGALTGDKGMRYPDCWFEDGQWWEYDDQHGDENYKLEVHNVTHWRPRPSAPESE